MTERLDDIQGRPVDHRLVFLIRAAVKFDLVEAGCVDIDEAITDLIAAFRQIVPPCRCRCEEEILTSFERHHLEQRQQRLKEWRRRS